MSDIQLKIQFKNCKSFGDDFQSINSVYPINLVIGKNNSGKTAILDVIEYVTKSDTTDLTGHKDQSPTIYLTKPASQSEIEGVFSRQTSGGGIPGENFFEFGSQWIDKSITIHLHRGVQDFVSIEPELNLSEPLIQQNGFHENLAKKFSNPLQNKIFRRLLAERNIWPEPSYDESDLDSEGRGATNIIQNFINLASIGNRSLVEKTLLDDLNKIFAPEINFTRIVTQKLKDGKWEIYLEEEGKNLIPLSNSGSGIKTVILVLINLLLLPILLGQHRIDNFIFAFEELENNLHPSLQRKLLLFIKNFAEKNGCIFFITTHSNTIIDLFSGDENAQIIHIESTKGSSSVKKIETYLDRKNVLDDLDFRASDLLQANGVVWVEGPSDRAYFNKWVHLWSEGKLKEGIHYQCLFYGGKLLAHFTALTDDFQEAISILKINRNCILLMDSDKDSSDSKVNETKERIKQEIDGIGGMSWITQGREVENYLPQTAIEERFQKIKLKNFGQFEKFPSYLESTISLEESEKFSRNKVLFAETIIPFLTLETLSSKFDLDEKMQQSLTCIKTWNKINL